MKRFLNCTFAIALCAAMIASASAKPQTVKGGANQQNGVQTTYPQPVFNGFVRIKPKYFGPARAQDHVIEQPVTGKKVMVFDAIISNGQTKPFMDDPSILLSDADGITADTRSVEPNGIILQRAAGAKLRVVFWVPDDFVPDHLVFTCQSTKCVPIRIKFKH